MEFIIDTQRGRVALVLEDAPLLRRRIVDMISEVEGLEEILEATDTETAVRLIQENQPDIVILDIRVPGNETYRNGIDVLRRIKQDNPKTAAVILTNYSGLTYRSLCLKTGANAFLDKSRDFGELVPVMRSLLDIVN